MSDRDRDDVVAALGRYSAEGRLDFDEYTDRAARARAATSRDELRAALGDLGPLPSSTGRGRRVLTTPLMVAAVLLACVAVMALLAALTPLAFGFHPAFFWVVPLIGFKVARLHHHRRPSERTISV